MSAPPDNELVASYAAEGSETAFRALVVRHVDMVYATAFRQLGDRGMAEEVTQNVFVALARKAPRLAGVETLAGWLHRTTVLEAKGRIRAELRRRRREEAAAELAIQQHEGAPALEALVPLLDEGLLNLRDGDRMALVLRFLEDRSLRDVGEALGVDEDAARKRVSRALDRLNGFFRSKGFALSAAGGVAAIFATSTQAAPAGLAASAASAGVSAAGAATGFDAVIYHLMTLTKTQTAVLCALVAAGPIAWQWHAEAGIKRDSASARARIDQLTPRAETIEGQVAAAREELDRIHVENGDLQSQLARLNAQRRNPVSQPVYQWDDNSAYVRIPKQFVERIRVAAVSDHRGHLSEQIKEILQMNEIEQQAVQSAMDRFLAAYHQAEAVNMKRVEPAKSDLNGRHPEEVRVFEVPSIGAQLAELRSQLFSDLNAALGPERFNLFKNDLDGWMPVDDEEHGFGSNMAVFDFDRRVRFYQPDPGDDWMSWGFEKKTGGSIQASLSLDEIPDFYLPALQEWITLARSKPSKRATAQVQ